MTTWEFSRHRPLLSFSRGTWLALIAELRRRGKGHRESGAFLLGRARRKRHKVTRVVYLDDLDPHCLQGGIRFDGLAYSRLWDICEEHRLVVLGDVHTHPGDFVHQSAIDAENPMIAQRGHVAIIVPYLATRSVEPCDLGVHRYEGTDGWTTWVGAAAAERVVVRRWL